MGCPKLNNRQHKGKIISMAKEQNNITTNEEKKQSKRNEVYIVLSLVFPALTLFGSVILFFYNRGYLDAKIESATASLNTQYESLETQYEELETQINGIHDHLYVGENSVQAKLQNIDQMQSKLEQDLSEIKTALNIKPVSLISEMTMDSISDITTSNILNSHPLSTNTSNPVIGTDIYENLCYLDDLINEKSLLTYEENGNELYFLGQYNEQFCWDGYCIINSYNSNGILQSIYESNFDNGARLDYKSLYHSGENEWTLLDRTYDDGSNSGIAVEYVLSKNIEKTFTKKNVRITDILSIEDFMKETEEVSVSQYYNGAICDGKYNDQTGNAYFAKYDSDGTIRTLYKGNFVNGCCEDNTGKAWNIAYSDELEGYFYNTGEFRDNSAVKKSTTPLTMEEIESIISQYNFRCNLSWKGQFDL